MRAVTSERDVWRTINTATYDRMAVDYFRRSVGVGIEEDAVEFVRLLRSDRSSRPRVLDLGSGPGGDAWRLTDAGASVICLDASFQMLMQGKQRSAPACAACGDFIDTPFASGSFRGVWACASLVHVPRAAMHAALAEIRRILAGGGWMYLAVPRGDGELHANANTGDARLFSYFADDELGRSLITNGFRPQTMSVRAWPGSVDKRPWIHGFAQRS